MPVKSPSTPAPDAGPAAKPPRAPTPTPTPPPAAPTEKMPPLDAAAKAQVLKLVKQIYEKEYGRKSAAAKRELAGELVAEADQIKNNFAAKFVLLQEAVSAGSGSGDVADSRKAIEGLDRTFVIDTVPMTVDALSKLFAAGGDEPKIADWAVQAVEDRIARDDYQGARQIFHVASAKVAGDADPALRERLKAADAALTLSNRVQAALDKLKVDPTDPNANFMAGSFFCFQKLDWSKGLPLLAKGTDVKLMALSRLDLASPTDAAAQFDLAGQWWDLGQDTMHAASRGALHERANYWCQKALPGLAALQKILAQKRLSEIPSGAAPRNILKELVSDGADPKTMEGGAIRLTKGTLKTPDEIRVPFALMSLQ